MKQPTFRSRQFGSRALPFALALVAATACGGPKSVGSLSQDADRPTLLSVQLGRLVDVYSYQRIDPTNGDRRDRFNRRLTLVAENLVINPNIESQSLFDAAGEELPGANFEFRTFSKSVGHEELVILWDDRAGPEAERYQAALQIAQAGLTELAPSYRNQNTQTRPIPIVPRNAAIKLNFSSPVKADEAFFGVNPSAIQLLEFKGDPAVVDPVNAFRILPYRPIPQGSTIVLDTTILGGEGANGLTVAGLPASSDNVTANIRVAIPVRGAVAPSFYVREDAVAELNGVDSAGRNSVIRDFRSGNLNDGVAGRLRESEPPMIVGSLPMGITEIDTVNNVITINKRLHFVPVRGRFPFVDGPLEQSGIPAGPFSVPISRPLRTGDILTQTLQVQMPDGSIESVELRAEILHNLEVGTVIGDQNLPRLGRVENGQGGSDQGERLSVVRVRVASLEAGRDSLGRMHSFEASSLPNGRDCVLRARYYDEVAYVGSTTEFVSDRDWRHEFVRIDPTPSGAVQPATQVSPNASIAVEFTKPLDLDQVDNTDNFLVTNTSILTESFAVQMGDAKRATARIVPTRLTDLAGDGTVLRLQPPMGFFHNTGTPETYAVHVRLGGAGVLDLAGNAVDIFGDLANPSDSWSVDFSLDAQALTNRVGWHTYTMTSEDEDGSLPGSVDMFGQYRLQDGRLFAAAGVRFSRTADNQNLATISRIHRGECWDPDFDPTVGSPQGVPAAPLDGAGLPHPGLLYWQPRMFDQIAPPNVPSVYEYYQQLPQNVGRVVEPHHPNGSRLQMRYLEDDFSLSYRQPSEFGLDVEQMYWSPFNDETVYYDVFDRYTMSLAHTARRADVRFTLIPGDSSAMPPVPPGCLFNCPSMNSGLSSVFADNVLPGTQEVPVFEDKVYSINPNQAFRSPLNVKYVPYPRFDRSYTWRDSRLVTVDNAGNVIGLGGAEQPGAPQPNNDTTANIDSPWIASVPDPDFVNVGGSVWVQDPADFVGDAMHDHDPIALPLLVDFKVFPDSAANGIAAGVNNFQVAMMGPPSYGFPGIPGGYYDRQGAGCGGTPPWPRSRVQATGGEDIISGATILIDPANQLMAQSSTLKDAGLGNATRALFSAPPGDGMVHWAQADFVRKVSTVTIGFFDSLQPQRAQLVTFDGSGTASINATNGFPDLLTLDPTLRIRDLVVQLDPPQSRQPAGTSVVVEIRGAEDFDNSGNLYNPSFDQASQTPDDTFDGRGNLLNVNYACEAYRYSQSNQPGNIPRINATQLTRYVTEDQLALIRSPATGLLPRFLNLRLVMTNNVDVSPALSPSLRSMSVVYKLEPGQ
ncbi:MAG: hypothetical protein H6838_20520 [Planctomycetes bacterium]|nr:hypothetical protein [Planctomycetota bacterium]